MVCRDIYILLLHNGYPFVIHRVVLKSVVEFRNDHCSSHELEMFVS